MGPRFPALLLLSALGAACGPADRTRLRIRGHGLSLDVVARSLPHQPHGRSFEIEVAPAADVTIDCRAGKDRHERTLADVSERSWTLYGLLADTEHDCTITATRGKNSLSGELSFTTDRLLDHTPEMELSRSGSSWGAYTLFNSWITGGGGGEQQLIIVDPEGRVRWAQALAPDLLVGVEARMVGPRRMLVGGGKMPPHLASLGGDVIWSFPEFEDDTRFWHHEAAPTPRGTLGVASVPNHDGSRSWDGFRVEERTDEGELLWALQSQDLFDDGVLPLKAGTDPWHANALSWVDDPEGPWVSLNLPRIDRMLAIEPDSGRVLWQMGTGLDIALDDGPWFGGQHDPEWSDGRVLLHDNGTNTGHTRVVELAVDPVGRTAETLWEWTEPGWFEPLWGDADRLEDGTVLVTRGHCAFCGDAGRGTSAIQVVEPETGEVRWRLGFPDPERGLYRAERIDGCALFDNLAYCE